MAERIQIDLIRGNLASRIRKQSDSIEITENQVFIRNADIIYLGRIDFNLDDFQLEEVEAINFIGCKFLDQKQSPCRLRVTCPSGRKKLVIQESEFELLHIDKCPSSILDNKGEIHIEGSNILAFRLDLTNNIYISNSHFLDEVSVQGKKIGEFKMTGKNTFKGKFEIDKKCEIQSLILNDFTSEKGIIKINDSPNIKTAEFKNIHCFKFVYDKITGDSAYFERCTFQEFKAFQTNQSLFIWSSVLAGSIKSCKGQTLEIEANTIEKLELVSNTFEETITSKQVVDTFSFNGNNGNLVLNGYSDIKTTKFPNLLDNEYSLIALNNWKFEEFQQVSEETKVNALVFSGVFANQTINISTKGVSRLDFNKCNSISEIYLDLQKTEIIQIHECSEIGQLDISGKIDQVFINTSDERVKNKIDHFSLRNVSSSNIAIISTEFQSVVLTQLTTDQFWLENSTYSNLTLSGTEIKNLRVGLKNFDRSDWFIQTSVNSYVVLENNTVEKLNIISEVDPPKGEQVDPPALNFQFIKNSKISELSFKISTQTKTFIYSQNNGFYDKISITAALKIGSSELDFQSDKINEIKINKIENSKFSLSDVEANQVQIEGSSFDEFRIEKCYSKNKNFGIRNLNILATRMRQFYLRNSSVDSLKLVAFNTEDFEVSNLISSDISLIAFKCLNENNQFRFINKDRSYRAKSLIIHDSDLGEMQLNSCFLDSFEVLDVQHSNLSDIRCASTTWPNRVVSFDENGKLDYFEIKEACRQLKIAMSDHQDRVSELQFHALEMEAYKNTVPLIPRKFNDLASLWAGWTNEFGLNWIRPASMLISFNFLLYLLNLKIHFNESWLVNPFRCWNWLDFLTVFNPVHNTQELYLGEIGGTVALLDFFGRIFTAFFLYQIVTAFRKYRK